MKDNEDRGRRSERKGTFLSGREGIKARVDIKAFNRDERREIAVDTDQNKGKRLRKGKGKKIKTEGWGKEVMERAREGNVHPPPSALSTLIAIFSAVGEGRKEKNTFLRMASISISYWFVYILQGKPIFFLTKLYCACDCGKIALHLPHKLLLCSSRRVCFFVIK